MVTAITDICFILKGQDLHVFIQQRNGHMANMASLVTPFTVGHVSTGDACKDFVCLFLFVFVIVTEMHCARAVSYHRYKLFIGCNTCCV